MSSSTTVYVLVEGTTEKIFIEKMLSRELWKRSVYLKPILLGGNISFNRAQKDIRNFLHQRRDTYITTFVDYYGVKEWPGVDENIPSGMSPHAIAHHINEETTAQIQKLFSDDVRACERFIPYMAIHEFEALLFSDSEILSSKLGVCQKEIDAVLEEFKQEPEAINNNRLTAPSKRLEKLVDGKYRKTTLGIGIAEAIGIPKMREKCPVFNEWLVRLENLRHEMTE